MNPSLSDQEIQVVRKVVDGGSREDVSRIQTETCPPFKEILRKIKQTNPAPQSGVAF